MMMIGIRKSELEFQMWVLAKSPLNNTPVTSDMIFKAVTLVTGVEKMDMISKSRKREFVEARQIAMYLIQRDTDCSLKRIGLLFGFRDHSTVIYSKDTAIDLIDTNKAFRKKVFEIEELIEKRGCQ